MFLKFVFCVLQDNVGEPKTKDAKFIRALMTGICSSALEGKYHGSS